VLEGRFWRGNVMRIEEGAGSVAELEKNTCASNPDCGPLNVAGCGT
jgi:hypothetical protein